MTGEAPAYGLWPLVLINAAVSFGPGDRRW